QHTTGRLATRSAGNMSKFTSKRQISVNARKFGSHFGRLQLKRQQCHRYNPTLNDPFPWLDGPKFVFISFQNVFSHGRAVPETYSPAPSGSVQNLSHFRLAERHPALAHAVMAPLICWSFSNSMFRYRLVDHAVPAMWRSLAAARLSAD